MDFILRVGEVSLSLLVVSLMLLAVMDSKENIDETKEYVNHQNVSSEMRMKYAEVAPFDYRTVDKISAQEVLSLIYTRASDSTPVILQTKGSAPRVFGSTAGWRYNSGTTNMGQKLDINGNPDNSDVRTKIGTINQLVEKLPEYKVLQTLLNGDSGQYYYCNIDPDNTGRYNAIVIKAAN